MAGIRINEVIDNLAVPPPSAYRIFIAPPGPRFTPTGRGCGNGYVQGYQTDSGETVWEGVSAFESRKEARQSFKKKQGEAVRIIERRTKVPDNRGNMGDRIVLETPPDDEGQTGIIIIWYGGGQHVREIGAPTLDLALEFEQYLVTINFRSPV